MVSRPPSRCCCSAAWGAGGGAKDVGGLGKGAGAAPRRVQLGSWITSPRPAAPDRRPRPPPPPRAAARRVQEARAEGGGAELGMARACLGLKVQGGGVSCGLHLLSSAGCSRTTGAATESGVCVRGGGARWGRAGQRSRLGDPAGRVGRRISFRIRRIAPSRRPGPGARGSEAVCGVLDAEGAAGPPAVGASRPPSSWQLPGGSGEEAQAEGIGERPPWEERAPRAWLRPWEEKAADFTQPGAL